MIQFCYKRAVIDEFTLRVSLEVLLLCSVIDRLKDFLLTAVISHVNSII